MFFSPIIIGDDLIQIPGQNKKDKSGDDAGNYLVAYFEVVDLVPVGGLDSESLAVEEGSECEDIANVGRNSYDSVEFPAGVIRFCWQYR